MAMENATLLQCFALNVCPSVAPLPCLRAIPSTQAGRACVVPAIWPLRHAQRAVCFATVRCGWLLSLSSVTISHDPTTN